MLVWSSQQIPAKANKLILSYLILSYKSKIGVHKALLPLVSGCGLGLAYIPAVSSVGKTFNKYRSLALGIAISGNGIGAFLFPPMIQFFLQEYCWRGTMLLAGAVCLNVCVCGGFLGTQQEQSPNNTTEKKTNETSENQNQKDKLSEMNLHVFRNTIFVILCLNNFFFYFGLSVVHVHLWAYASSVGFTEYQGAMLFSALGIANFAGCIMLGLIGNTPCITSIALCTMS